MRFMIKQQCCNHKDRLLHQPQKKLCFSYKDRLLHQTQINVLFLTAGRSYKKDRRCPCLTAISLQTGVDMKTLILLALLGVACEYTAVKKHLRGYMNVFIV